MLSQDFASLKFALVPDNRVCLGMLDDLHRVLGSEPAITEALSVPRFNLVAWRARQRRISLPNRRVIWFAWTILLHPETLETSADFSTWGKIEPTRRLWAELSARVGTSQTDV